MDGPTDCEIKLATPQTAAIEYLRYYCDQSNQFDYAVLVRGKWGAGKTFFINKFLTERKEQGFEKNLYVSLYGLSSFRQIDEALYRQVHPVLSSKGMKLAAAISKSILKATTKIDLDGNGKEDLTVSSNIPDVDILDYFKTPKECLLVFDDLERCSMKVSDVLGYINAFVGHEGFKAIIVANEEEILKREDERYQEIKEKLVGQTLTIHSSVADALPYFLTLVADDRTRKYLTEHLEDIQLLHSQSETDNLRLLKHALWDFERLGLCFTDRHWDNEEAVGILFRNVLSLSFEVRKGRLTEDQLLTVAENSGIRLFQKKSDESSIEDELKKRYPEIEFAQQIASPIWLKTLLFDGRVEKLETQNMLDGSTYYASPQTLPAWRVAWNWWEIDEKSFEDAVTKVEDQFSKREILIFGEVFHVFGLRLLFAEIGVISKSKPDVVNECKRYIDNLYKSGKLPDPLASIRMEIETGWGGLGFYDRGSEEFTAIVKHFYEVSFEALKQSLSARAYELLDLMEHNVQDFFRQLCLNNVSASPFFDIPVLADIPPDEFVDRVLVLPPSAQGAIFSIFEGRYERNALIDRLKDEKPWILSVKHTFEKRMETMGKMPKYRLKSRIGHSFGKFLTPEEMEAATAIGGPEPAGAAAP